MEFAYLATKPVNGVLVALLVAVILFAVGAVLAVIERSFYGALVAAGLAAFVLAFLIS